MSQADLLFWLSLALVLAGVAVLPMRARQAWLILASLGIYGAPDPMRLVWLAGACAVTLMAAHPAEPGAAHRRGLGIAALVLCLVWARFFELAGLPDPEAPPGLSFIIFTAIAAIIEKGRREGAA